MAHQLGSGAASAEKSAASVLASMAVLFRDLISLAHTLASAAESQESPSSKENVAHHSNGSHPDGNLFWVVGYGSEVHSYAEDKVRSHEQQNRQEGVIGSVKRARNTAPGQLHSANDLGHCNLRAAGWTPDGRVADSCLEALKGAILPAACRCIQSNATVVFRERNKENLPFRDSSFRLIEKSGKIMVEAHSHLVQERLTTSMFTNFASSPLIAVSKVYPAGRVAGAVTWIIIGRALPGFRGVALSPFMVAPFLSICNALSKKKEYPSKISSRTKELGQK
jgi:hypothetical protein